MTEARRCLLDETKWCDNCGECDRCDLDPNKLCDNCMKCISSTGADYLAIEIDDILMSENDEEAEEEQEK